MQEGNAQLNMYFMSWESYFLKEKKNQTSAPLKQDFLRDYIHSHTCIRKEPKSKKLVGLIVLYVNLTSILKPAMTLQTVTLNRITKKNYT